MLRPSSLSERSVINGRPWRLLFLLPFLLTRADAEALSKPDAPLAPDPRYAQVAKRFAAEFPREHLTRAPLDDSISVRAWTNYLAALDYDRVFFLASDVETFRSDERHLEDRLRQGDLGFAYRVFEVFKQRVENRCDYVAKLLGEGFDIEKDERYSWKRKNAPWPENAAEWNELWRKKIKNEYIQHVVAVELSPALSATKGRVERESRGYVTAGETNGTFQAVSNGLQGANDHGNVAGTNQSGVLLSPAPGGKNRAEKMTETDQDASRSPEDVISRRYRQFLTVLKDSDSDWVLQRYLSAFAHAYDPHSDYLSPSAMEDFNIEMRLSLVGIGAMLGPEDGAAKVVRLIPGGPADRDKRDVRLSPGDRIVAVAQGDEEPVDVLHWPLHKVVSLIRGEKGTRVVLTVIPAADPTGSSTKLVDLVRDQVNLEEEAAKSRVEPFDMGQGITGKLGIVTLPAFYANVEMRSSDHPAYRSSAYDVENILGELRREGVKGILLDLRNNGGGYLPEAVRMTGLFIRMGPTVQVRERNTIRVLPDSDPSVACAAPMVVLVNRLSASASEILAGALQDYGRAVIVGDSKTHGKGTVQTIVPLGRDPTLGSLKITEASYYRVSGRSTQLGGVTPDIVISSAFDALEFGEDYLPNALALSPVADVPYEPWANLRPLIPGLRQRSLARRASDPHFGAYTQFLGRIEEMNKAAELPLQMAKRKELAKTEKELYDLQKQIDPDAESAPKDGEAPGKKDGDTDLVLDEGLRILADLARLQPEPPTPAAGFEVLPSKTFADTVREWLRNNL